MSEMSRREALAVIAAAPAAAALKWRDAGAATIGRARAHVDTARREAERTGAGYEPEFFDADEWRMLRVLVDMIIPADDRSGSATDAGVPEFIDFTMTDQDYLQTPMRGGLAWLDRQCEERFGAEFADCSEKDRRAMLDLIAWPDRAPADLEAGVEFFNSLRDLTATGFWSSKMGVEDLEYMGNAFVPDWDGCPPEALEKLGVRY